MSRVSFIIPVYNDVKRLRRSVQSALGQTYPDIEVVIVDDGSTDGSRELAQQLASEDGRVHVLTQQQGGPARARNNGARHASGEYLAILDGDDMAEPKRAQRQVAVLEQNPDIGVVATHGYRISVAGQRIGRVAMGPLSVEEFRARRDARKLVYVINGTVMMRRSLFLQVNGYPEDYKVGEDLALYNLRLAPLCDFLVLPEPLTSIEVHEDSTSRRNVDAIIESDDVVRLNLRRVYAGLPQLSYADSMSVLARSPLLQRLSRRRRVLRYRWFNRGAASIAGGSHNGIVWLLAAFAVAPAWTLRLLLPRVWTILPRSQAQRSHTSETGVTSAR